MRRSRRVATWLLAGVLLLAPSPGAAADWKSDFERICAHTLDAASLPSGEIRKLIEETDDLMARIEKIGERCMKVYIFRLRKCRKFFVYALELKEPEGADTAGTRGE